MCCSLPIFLGFEKSGFYALSCLAMILIYQVSEGISVKFKVNSDCA